MSRSRLSSRDVALLERLNRSSVEVGELPGESVSRLTALGLVRQVLGWCEITRSGQLIFHRRNFRKLPRSRFARVTQRNPLFFQETRLSQPAGRARLADLLPRRRLPVNVQHEPG